MNAITFIKFSRKYAACPECGNDKVGGGEGKMIVDNDTFHRSCKCGWEITLSESEGK